MQSVTTMAQMWGFAHCKLKLSSARPQAPKQSTGLFLSFGLPCLNPVLYSKNKYRGGPRKVQLLGERRNDEMSELMTFSLSNKKVVTNDMKSVTTMAQMWGFAHWKLKLSSARPRAPKQSTGLFLSFGLPCSNPVLYSKNKKPQKRLFIFGADVGIRTPEASLKTYTISNRAPSASSDTSAYLMLWYYNLSKQKNQCLFFIIFNFKFICKI